MSFIGTRIGAGQGAIGAQTILVQVNLETGDISRYEGRKETTRWSCENIRRVAASELTTLVQKLRRDPVQAAREYQVGEAA